MVGQGSEYCEIQISEGVAGWVRVRCILEAVATGRYGRQTLLRKEFMAGLVSGDWAGNETVNTHISRMTMLLIEDGWELTDTVIHPIYGVSLPKFRQQSN